MRLNRLLLTLAALVGSALAQYTVPLHGGVASGSAAVGCGTYAGGFAHYGTIAIQSSKVSGSANLSNFLLYFAGNSALETMSSSSGYDVIACTSAVGGTQLTMVDVPMNASTSTGAVEKYWIVPTVSYTTNTTIYVFWDDSSITTDQGNGSTFCSTLGLLAFYPFGTSSSENITDLCGLNTPTNHGTTAVAGEIYGGAAFAEASSEYIDGAGSSNTNTTDVTIEAWVYYSSSVYQGTPVVVNKVSNAGYAMYIGDGTASSGHQYPSITTYASSTSYGFLRGGSSISTNAWNHVVGTYNGGNVNSSSSYDIYINGSLNNGAFGSAGSGSMTGSSVDLEIGYAGGWNYWNGNLDEVRIWNSAVGAGYVGTLYNNMNAPTTFYTFTQVQ